MKEKSCDLQPNVINVDRQCICKIKIWASQQVFLSYKAFSYTYCGNFLLIFDLFVAVDFVGTSPEERFR